MPFQKPGEQERAERLSAVLHVLYLISWRPPSSFVVEGGNRGLQLI